MLILKKMPRTQLSNIRKFFIYKISTDSSVCQIDDCGTALRRNHASNLQRHVKRFHQECFKKYKEKYFINLSIKSKKIHKNANESLSENALSCCQTTLDKKLFKTVRVKIDAHLLRTACLEMVTVNGRPFKIVEDSGFRKLLNPISQALSDSGNKICINAENIREEVVMLASKIKKEIKEDIRDKFISLKIDIATRMDRAILGINIQLIKNGKLTLRTIAMKELTHRHTAEYIKNAVADVLEQYEISISQIYTVTTDNGANMLKSVKLLSNEQLKENAFADEDSPGTSQAASSNSDVENDVYSDEDSECEATDSSAFNIEILLESLAAFDFVESTSRPMLRGLRCAAYTLQLAVDDALKQSSLKSDIAKARHVCKILRNPSIMVILKKLKRKKPILDCVTRWHSTCDMLQRLLSLKDFCQEMAVSNAELHLLESQWNLFSEIVTALEPARKAAKALQQQHLTLGDFYGIWLRCKLEISKASPTEFSQLLLSSIKKRELALLENDVFVACIFLDPRYKVLLNEEEKTSAIAHLQNTWISLQNLKSQSINFTDQNRLSPDLRNSGNDDDDLEVMLKAHELESAKQKVFIFLAVIVFT